MRNKIHNKKTNSIKSTKSNKINFDRSYETEIETRCRLCEYWKEKNQELNNKIKDLEEIIKSYDLLQLADKLKDIEFEIPKENQPKIDESFSSCDKRIKVRFHGYYTLSSIQPDNARKNLQDQNTSLPNNSSDPETGSNDSDTLLRGGKIVK